MQQAAKVQLEIYSKILIGRATQDHEDEHEDRLVKIIIKIISF